MKPTNDSGFIDHPIIQLTAIASLTTAVVGILPVIVGVPASIYYILLIIEKITGRPLHATFNRNYGKDNKNE